ncbi:hypothetical protein CWI81_01020 [Idiomarina seosinensis]|uniref:Uncharacterized protein n=1 Tax=Idiomarina seosinensis TaxID=281739 RepID=A0A432ZGT5_9GAMM|nr:hypothetical protein CWI81_01020 [Idiomarina seosinensis]
MVFRASRSPGEVPQIHLPRVATTTCPFGKPKATRDMNGFPEIIGIEHLKPIVVQKEKSRRFRNIIQIVGNRRLADGAMPHHPGYKFRSWVAVGSPTGRCRGLPEAIGIEHLTPIVFKKRYPHHPGYNSDRKYPLARRRGDIPAIRDVNSYRR